MSMPQIPKVREDKFNAVLRALLKAPPAPMAEIQKELREPKQMNGPRSERGLGGKLRPKR